MKPLTADQKTAITFLRMNGASYPRIAAVLRLHQETVARFCRKNKIDSDARTAVHRFPLWKRLLASFR